MIIETERLELVPLNPYQLRLWVEDMAGLEHELDCVYQGEPLAGAFLQIAKQQLAITEKDPKNDVWHSFWLMIRRADRVVVGSADFKDIPDSDQTVEIGYGLGEQFEHNGYMTEAVQAMCRWALRQPGVSSILAETGVDAAASQNVLRRSGFHLHKQSETLWWKR